MTPDCVLPAHSLMLQTQSDLSENVIRYNREDLPASCNMGCSDTQSGPTVVCPYLHLLVTYICPYCKTDSSPLNVNHTASAVHTSMQWNLFSEDCQEKLRCPSFLRKPEFYYRVHNSPLFFLILRHITTILTIMQVILSSMSTAKHFPPSPTDVRQTVSRIQTRWPQSSMNFSSILCVPHVQPI